jgi:hypothetical protein
MAFLCRQEVETVELQEILQTLDRRLSRGPPAVGADHLSNHEAGVVGSEVERRGGDVTWLAEAQAKLWELRVGNTSLAELCLILCAQKISHKIRVLSASYNTSLPTRLALDE